MRFESVTAHAFGPMSGRTIELASGMTIVYGPNESGKSTWHAALYVGLCGMRRTRGQPRTDEREFASRHRPWDGEAWEVSVGVALDDGRRVELRHDLNGRADCRATDLALGRDVSAEIINEGTPDGARWLGLDRRSFLATACVRQADILSIRGAPELLHEHLQRAAATARTDATATEAIARLRDFQTTNVGREWVKTRPLGRAVDTLQDAERTLTHAQSEHREFLRLTAQAEELRVRAERFRADLRLLEAAAATRDAEAGASRLSRATQLAARYLGGPPAPLVEDDELARRVAAAVAGWMDRPRITELQGESAEELQKLIAALPSMPGGDLEPNADVLAAREAYQDADRFLTLHDAQRPLEPGGPELGGVPEQELRDLARDLESSELAIDPILENRVERAKKRVYQLASRSGGALLSGVGIIGVAAAVGAVVAWGVLAGLLLLVAAGGLVAWMVAGANAARARALEELCAAENAVGEARYARDAVVRQKEASRARARVLGLPADPATLRSLADRVAETERQRRHLGQWMEHRQGLSLGVTVAGEALAAALRSRGGSVGNDVGGALETYLSGCTDRARLAASARHRVLLESQLAARQATEEAWRRVTDAERNLRAAAVTCGIVGTDDEALCQGLKEWQTRRAAALQKHQTALEEWTELQTLLAGRTLDEINEEATRKQTLADRSASGLDAGQVSALSKAGDLDERVAGLRRELEEALEIADRVRGQVEDRARRLPSVPEAEEAVARAQHNLERVRLLERTLGLTLEFLERAEERVHRDIAPVLAQTVKRWLPEVTVGRYTDAIVDPETLRVQVRDPQGRWRDAAVLSHGTAEQIYLLVRMAMAQHLAKPGETCPLILDEVTVQCDRVRTEAIMRCLHAISRDRQVIVFTQQEEVLAWAQSHVDGSRDRLIQLEGPGAAI